MGDGVRGGEGGDPSKREREMQYGEATGKNMVSEIGDH